MFRGATGLEKGIVMALLFFVMLLAITISVDLSNDVVMWIYVSGIVLIIVILEICFYFHQISNRFKEYFVRIPLRVQGASPKCKIYIEVDGKLIHRFTSEYNGTIKLRKGQHKIAVFNKIVSASEVMDVSGNVSIRAHFEDFCAKMHLERMTGSKTEDELERELVDNKRMSVFFSLFLNILFILMALRILFILM